MDSAALTSLTPLLDGIDKWVELAPLLPVIISLELILSADNVVALASITRRLKDKDLQTKALNIGISLSLLLRIFLILFSRLILRYKFIELFCGIYLLFLFIQKILGSNTASDSDTKNTISEINSESLIKVILLLAITDLAFSIDSITAAVSISDQLLLVLTGASIGVIALRFTSSLFVRWLSVFSRLEFSGYLAIGLIGLKLIFELLFTPIVIPEYIVFFIMTIVFLWGFSLREGTN